MTILVRKAAALIAGAAFATCSLSALVPPTGAQEGTAKAKAPKAKTSKTASARAAEAAVEEDADEPEAPKAKAKAKAKAKSKAASPEVSHRVPMYFGGLGLSEDQRESIYAVEAKYQPQIQDLQRQTEVLRDRLIVECENVLTAPQKKALDAARQSAADRRKAASERRKAGSQADVEEAAVAPEKAGVARKAAILE